MIKYEYKTDPTFLFPNKLQRPKSPTYTRIPIKIIRCEKKKKERKWTKWKSKGFSKER